MKDQKLHRMILGALFAALCAVATLAIQIPSPMNGYVNLGDCVVLLSGWLLGPLYGGLAAGIGSMLADVMTGYVHYAPGTLLIKGAMALAAALLYRMWKAAAKGHPLTGRILSGMAAEALMVAGYFGYASLLLGKGWAAAASIPGNLIQGVFGLLSAVLFMQMFAKSEAMKRYFSGLMQ